MNPTLPPCAARVRGTPVRAARLPGALAGALGCALAAQTAAAADPGTVLDAGSVIVTASKLPADFATVPAMVSVISGDELRSRGARDLRSALSLVAGVDIAPGGDAGPAGSVPGLWGLREFDAFLLVVDGVPYGGAFNPALATLDLTNVDRIEVVRGSAPVNYGATSFVGVIHVLHAEAGRTPASAGVAGGSRGTAQAWVRGDLPASGDFRHSLSLDGERRGFSQDDSSVGRAHALYRSALDTEAGTWRADVDLTRLRQDPYSPHPREGSGLSVRVPLDANVNPADARQDQDRAQLTLGFQRDEGVRHYAVTLSAAHTDGHTTRGFLREDFAGDGTTVNADGFRQRVRVDDLYFDASLTVKLSDSLRWVSGVDWLYGRGRQSSENFEYPVLPDGANRESSFTRTVDEATSLTVRRNFGGLYTQVDWDLTSRWKLLAGARLNRTDETRSGAVVSADPDAAEEGGRDSRTVTRGSGSVGTSYALWRSGSSYLTAFADWRSSYKPAAADLGPEAESDILKPETGRSWEAGLRARLLDERLTFESSWFDMDFRNLVIRENVGGLPALANAGRQRLKGGELEASWALAADTRLVATYAHHDSRFVDYARLRPDGSIQQLAGKTLELAPRELAAFGLVHAPAQGPLASVVWSWSGSRWLNKGNSVRAGGFAIVDAGLGWRTRRWELRVDGVNLTDRRDPVAESELGDAQFYRLPGRSVLGSVSFRL